VWNHWAKESVLTLTLPAEIACHAYIYDQTFSRRLYLILSILLGEEGLQHSVPGMKKDSFTTIISIFKSIKSSQDVVDGSKTKVKCV
jgi:hypothetical protein